MKALTIMTTKESVLDKDEVVAFLEGLLAAVEEGTVEILEGELAEDTCGFPVKDFNVIYKAA